MSREHQPRPRNHRFLRLAGLGLSAAALAGLVHLQSVWAHADVQAETDLAASDFFDELELDELELEADQFEAEALAEVDALEAAQAKAVALTAVAMAPTATEVRVALAPAPAPIVVAAAVVEVPALVAVPNLGGMSLRAARKELKALGLRMSVRDRYNDRVARDEWSFYKVRGQKIDPGTEVEPGSRVRVKAKIRRSRKFAQGY
jgi:hypothetical protein